MKKTTTEFAIYKDKKREFRWRAWRGNRIVAESGEGYKRRAGLRKTLRHFIESIERKDWVEL